MTENTAKNHPGGLVGRALPLGAALPTLPEIIAPLDCLRKMIERAGPVLGGHHQQKEKIMNRYTQKEMIRDVANFDLDYEAENGTPAPPHAIINKVFDLIKEKVEAGELVMVPKFGTFKKHDHIVQVDLNPATDLEKTVTTCDFRLAGAFWVRLNNPPGVPPDTLPFTLEGITL